HMDVVHKLPLTIGGFIWPSIAVHVQSTARNFAIPYSLFMFKHWDPNDYNGNGATGFNIDQKAGDNGGTSFVGGAKFTFQCLATGGLAILVPPISADPAQPKGPRYGTVSNSGTLVLAPGVYFFEGSTAGSGFLNQSATATTVDCYGAAYSLVTPTCWTGGGGG